MGSVICEISMSLDGYVAGPNPTLEDPLGEGGELLHDWVIATRSWREAHGMEGGEDNADSRMFEATFGTVGATVMGRRMFSGGEGPWEDDPRANGWWGDEPPFEHPVFVLTHHEREPLTLGATTFTYVTDGIESALDQARAAAGDRDVTIAGGGETIRQYVDAALADELRLHVAPLLLGGGARLFDGGLSGAPRSLECHRIVDSPAGVAHLSYRLR